MLNMGNVSAINLRTYKGGLGGGCHPYISTCKHLRQHLKFSVALCLSLAPVLRQV